MGVFLEPIDYLNYARKNRHEVVRYAYACTYANTMHRNGRRWIFCPFSIWVCKLLWNSSLFITTFIAATTSCLTGNSGWIESIIKFRHLWWYLPNTVPAKSYEPKGWISRVHRVYQCYQLTAVWLSNDYWLPIKCPIWIALRFVKVATLFNYKIPYHLSETVSSPNRCGFIMKMVFENWGLTTLIPPLKLNA